MSQTSIYTKLASKTNVKEIQNGAQFAQRPNITQGPYFYSVLLTNPPSWLYLQCNLLLTRYLCGNDHRTSNPQDDLS